MKGRRKRRFGAGLVLQILMLGHMLGSVSEFVFLEREEEVGVVGIELPAVRISLVKLKVEKEVHEL